MSYFIGLLSGTSVDSIDAAIVSIDEHHIKLIESHEHNFSSELQLALKELIKTQTITLENLLNIDARLADEFSMAIEHLIKKSKIVKSNIVAIGSHGQTIFHQPNGDHRNTLQIGSLHRIAANTDLTVIGNFRNLDMAYGGQGAPLAPIIHHKIFFQAKINTAVINLGGITNISFIGRDYKNPLGFDVGPANCLIDEWISLNKQKSYDNNGDWARQGQLNQKLLKKMMNDDFFLKSYPKSTGREYFNLNWLNNLDVEISHTSAVDIQTTLTHLIASTIAQAIQHQPNNIDVIIIMGGGARNGFIKQLIYDYTHITTHTSEFYGYKPQWIESILFAYLAYKRINHQEIELSSITGSSKSILVGDIIES